MGMRIRRLPLFVAFATAAVLLGACQTTPPDPAEVSDVEEISAKVTAVDHAKRGVTLRNAQGEEVSFRVSDEVRNFDQIEVGDTLSVSYYRAFAAEVTEADPTDQIGDVEVGAERAAPGERPGAAAGTSVTSVVAIEAVDKKSNTVTFRNADGVLRVIDVRRPEMQAFVQKLKQGDRVRVTYTEAVAIAVRPTD
jgi:hypothetical protein